MNLADSALPEFGRSREGAWIEIATGVTGSFGPSTSRSREGAWIEINVTAPTTLKPYGRSREGAWIEIKISSAYLSK